MAKTFQDAIVLFVSRPIASYAYCVCSSYRLVGPTPQGDSITQEWAAGSLAHRFTGKSPNHQANSKTTVDVSSWSKQRRTHDDSTFSTEDSEVSARRRHSALCELSSELIRPVFVVDQVTLPNGSSSTHIHVVETHRGLTSFPRCVCG